MSDIPKEKEMVVCIDKKASGGHATRAPGELSRGGPLVLRLFCISRKLNRVQRIQFRSIADSESPIGPDEMAIFVHSGGVRQEVSAGERDPNRALRHRVCLTRANQFHGNFH